MDTKSDVVIVGGGLAGCLAALKLKATRPELHLVLLEESEKLGGHQTWTFHDSDLPNAASLAWLAPVIARSWEDGEVRFPKLQKTLPGKLNAIRSDDLQKHLCSVLGDDVFLKTSAARLSESHVETAAGDIFAARLVIDARGALPAATPAASGFFKYMAREFELAQAHGLSKPLLVDATCPQLDGLRFFRVLPWGESRLRVEEIFFSTSPLLNRERIRRSIEAYVERGGWRIARSVRDEEGVLNIPLTSSYISTSLGGEALPIGKRGGYFHAATGLALPDSVRISEFLAGLEDLNTANARTGLIKMRRPWLSRQRFYRLLNRFLFYAAEPALRYQVLQSFYEQPVELIERFSSGRTSWSDRFRFLSSRSHLPWERTLKSLTEKSVQSWMNSRQIPERKAN